MTSQQWILSLVLATLVFSVALELRLADFKRVAQAPRAVLCGLIRLLMGLPVAMQGRQVKPEFDTDHFSPAVS